MHDPTLTDGELTLRPPRARDADALTAACQDPEIPRWTRVPSPYAREHAVAWIALAGAEARAGTAVALLGFDRDDALLGSFSLMDLRSAPRYGEIGYWLAAPARGRGIATRAVRLLTGWGHAALGLERIEIHVDVDNERSQRVPERAGYVRLPGLHAAPRTGVEEHRFVRWVSHPQGSAAGWTSS